jgi:hypothetical protein
LGRNVEVGGFESELENRGGVGLQPGGSEGSRRAQGFTGSRVHGSRVQGPRCSGAKGPRAQIPLRLLLKVMIMSLLLLLLPLMLLLLLLMLLLLLLLSLFVFLVEQFAKVLNQVQQGK